MINFKTVLFLKTMDELAEKSKNGIVPFSKANNDICLLYDDESNKVIHLCIMDSMHHDIISYADNEFLDDQLSFCVHYDEYSLPYVVVHSKLHPSLEFIIEDGKWYISSY